MRIPPEIATSILPRASCAGTAANSRSQPLRRLDRHRRGEGPTAGLPLRNASRHVVGRDPGSCSIANPVTSTDSARRPLRARNGRGDTGTDYRAGGIAGVVPRGSSFPRIRQSATPELGFHPGTRTDVEPAHGAPHSANCGTRSLGESESDPEMRPPSPALVHHRLVLAPRVACG
jgi:hypothetical protein